MKHSIEDITSLIANKTGCAIEEILPDCDIDHDLGCTGDDFDELIAEYVKRFGVNMDNYLWYFHTKEEGSSLGGLFFKSPDKRVKHIPVTPRLLLELANEGKWSIDYPPHSLPKYRYDILLNMLFLISFLIFAIYRCSR